MEDRSFFLGSLVFSDVQLEVHIMIRILKIVLGIVRIVNLLLRITFYSILLSLFIVVLFLFILCFRSNTQLTPEQHRA